MEKPLLGISACLLGENVRFDGGHKAHEWLIKELGKQVEWHPICPEMEMGLGAPRESVRLIAHGDSVEMVGNKSGDNLSTLAKKTAAKIVGKFPATDGMVFKKNSPSCGLERVRVEKKNGYVDRNGQGLFAQAFTTSFPLVPCTEEGRMEDVEEREHFVMRVFARRRWRDLPKTIASVQLFHQRYKFILMAHNQRLAKELGKLAANSDRRPVREVSANYEVAFTEALSKRTTPGRRYNVLQHLFGFLKDRISEKEKKSLGEELESYRSGEISFQAIIALLRHSCKHVGVPYLEENLFWDPYPKALGLRRFLE